jgi:hypothetical protein
MSYPAFVAAIEDAFLDEEVNARGELSARQHGAVMESMDGHPVDLTLRRADGTLLEGASSSGTRPKFPFRSGSRSSLLGSWA